MSRLSDAATLTVFTCASDLQELRRLDESLARLEPHGFRVERDHLDNRTAGLSAAQALNLGWARARGDLVVFCHDDVVFPPDWLRWLREGIERVEALDGGAPWAVLGPMGRAGKAWRGRASGPDGVETLHPPLPAAVETLDELCLIVPRSLPLRFDEALGGFHLYGVDLCIAAIEAGRSVWAIEAPLQHFSSTRHRPPDYHVVKRRLQRKWRWGRRRVGRSVGTTCGRIRFGLLEGWL